MLYRKLYLAIILPIIAACSATGKLDCEGNFIYSPDSFTPEQQEWIEESSVRWNKWAGRQVTSVRPGYSRGCFITAGKTRNDQAIGEEHSNSQNIVIDVDDLTRFRALTRERFEGIVMHEMGHALGLNHVGKDGEALMATAGGLDFTEQDRLECIKREVCLTLLPEIPPL